MEGVFKAENRGAARVGAGDLDGVLDGFGSCVDEDSFLGEVAGCDCVQAFGDRLIVVSYL